MCMVMLWESFSEMDKRLNKAMDRWEVTEEHLIGYGGVFREDIHGPESVKGKGKGSYKDIVVNMDEVKWIEEGWQHGYKVFIGDLPGNIGKMDLAEVTRGQVDLAINASATRSGMAFAIVTFNEVAAAIECCKKASVLKLDPGNCVMHWACPKWLAGKKANRSNGSGMSMV